MEVQQFPKMLYKKDAAPVTVQNEDEQKELGAGWSEHPVDGSKHVNYGDGVVHPYTGKEVIESSATKQENGTAAPQANATKEFGADESSGVNQVKGTKQ